jgi:hypothetical protein
MKYVAAALWLLVGAAQAQTNLRSVMTDANGVIQRPTNFMATNRIVSVQTSGTVSNPTNFWTANAAAINAVITAESQSVLGSFAYADSIDLANAEQQSDDAVFENVSQTVTMRIEATNASATAAMRMTRYANYSPLTGSGIRWNITNSFFVRLAANLFDANDRVRFVLGNDPFATNSFISSLTNSGVGFEMRKSGSDNQIRLIAHNGSTSASSAWINASTTTGRLNVGVVSAAGAVTLYMSRDSVPLALVTNIVITNGPTVPAGGQSGGFSGGMVTTTTNAFARTLYVFDAALEAQE